MLKKKEFRKIDSPQPLYIRLYEHLRAYIDTEDARKTGKLPTELELCRLFRLSRNTVTQALAMLEAEQLICRIKHRGTFLASALNEFDPQSIRRTVGVLFPSEGSWDDALAAIRRECRILGYDFRYYTYSWKNRADELRQLEKARKSCGGIILYPGGNGEDNDCIRTLFREFPVVLFDLFIPEVECNSVATDHYQGAYVLAEALISRGCRRFGIIRDQRPISSLKLRYAAFWQALKDNGITFCREINSPKAEELTGFIRENDLDAVLDTGKHLFYSGNPSRQLWLGRFDTVSEVEMEFCRVAKVVQNHRELGSNAINLLKTVMRSGVLPGRKILIAPEIEIL